MQELQFENELGNIISKHYYNTNEPLDGDEVDRLIEIIRNEINLMQGNITNKEFEELMLQI